MDEREYPLGLIGMVLSFIAVLGITAAITFGMTHSGDNDREVLKSCIQSERTASECRAVLNGTK
jgi:hypothetical protein